MTIGEICLDGLALRHPAQARYRLSRPGSTMASASTAPAIAAVQEVIPGAVFAGRNGYFLGRLSKAEADFRDL
jgi:hypothetical protein